MWFALKHMLLLCEILFLSNLDMLCRRKTSPSGERFTDEFQNDEGDL